MGYQAHLQDLLRPLGLYDVETGASGAELAALGQGMDGVFDAQTELEREANPATARDWGLGMYEDILPYQPAASSVKKRRAAVMALLRIDGASFTLQAIRDTVAGCGITAEVAESDTPQTVAVSFPGVRGAPDRFQALQARIEQILPCHLAVEYVLVYLTWQELEGMGWTWQCIEDKALTWDGLERYTEEEEET